MPTHGEKRCLPYSVEQLYALVSDVERYPQFLPWCVAARITRRETDWLTADLIVGFKMIRERFSSRVTFGERRIDVTYTDGPFKYLNNHWIFVAEGEQSTVIDFYIDFEFRSRLLQKLMGAVFNEAVRMMVGAFEKRAHHLYAAETQG
jgi:coenzyme Q-binding protein COQ10